MHKSPENWKESRNGSQKIFIYYGSPSTQQPMQSSSTKYFCTSEYQSVLDGRQSGGNSDSGIETSDTDNYFPDEQVLFSNTRNMPLLSVPILQTAKLSTSSHSVKEISCPVCFNVFEDKSALLQHLNLFHSDVIRVTCKVCSQEFTLPEMINHSPKCKGQHVCQQCRATFAQRPHLLRHISRTHQFNEQCSCNVCGRILSSKCALKVHKKQHENIPSFKCEFCDFGCKQYFHLQLHIDSRHGDDQLAEVPKPHECLFCGRAFVFNLSLKAHLRIHNSDSNAKEKTLQCGFLNCGKQFSHLSELKKHQYAHLSPEHRPLVCSYCPRSFNRRYDLEDHETWHRDNHLFTCSECGQNYSSAWNLRRHFRKHMLDGFDKSSNVSFDDHGISLGADIEFTNAVLDEMNEIKNEEDLDLDLLNEFLNDDANNVDYIFKPKTNEASSSQVELN